MATVLDAVINLKDNFSNTLQQVEKSVGSFSRTTKTMGRDIQRTGGSVGAVGGTLTKSLTMPLIGVGTAAGKLGIDFEKTMSGVKAVTGASGKEFEDLEKKAREMGRNTTKSSSEAAEAMEYMGMAGWETSQIIDGIEPVLRLSEAGTIDLARASDLVTDSMSAMGIEVQDLDGYLDIVAQTARSSNTDVDAMMEAYLGVGGVLRGLNIPLEESAVSLGMLATAGIKGGEAGKSLSAILTNLTAPTGRAKKALDDLGFSAFDSQGEFKGLDNILFELKDELSGMDTEQQNMVKSMIAGKEHTKGLNALLNGLDDSYEELSGSIGEADGALMTMVDIMNDNTAGSISGLSASLEEVGLSIYDTLRPAIVEVIDTLQGFADRLNNLTPEQQEMISQFAKLAIVIGPAMMVLGKMTGSVGKLVTEFGFLAGRMAKLGLGPAILTPGLKVVLVLGAMIAAGVMLYKNWDEIKAKVNEVFPNLQEQISITMEHVKNIVTGAVSAIALAWDFLGPALTIAFEVVKSVLMAGLEFMGSIISNVIQAISGVTDFITGVFTGNWELAWQGVSDIFSGIFGGLLTIAKAPLNGIISLVNGVIGGLNKISLPDWVPGIGGKGVNIPLIPRLAKGTKSWGGGIAQVHERGGEIIDLPGRSRVYPHDKSVSMAREQGRKESARSIVVSKLADKIIVREEADIDKIANSIVRKISGASFNMT